MGNANLCPRPTCGFAAPHHVPHQTRFTVSTSKRTMRIVLQRVTSGSVRVGEEMVGSIGKGLVCLVGIAREDSEEDAEYCCRKLLNVRLWPDDKGKQWNTSVVSNGFEVLLVSQFTLHGYFQGNKPDFHLSMGPGPAKEYYDAFVQRVKNTYQADKVQDGRFGAYMDVELVNDGPVTMIIDSKSR